MKLRLSNFWSCMIGWNCQRKFQTPHLASLISEEHLELPNRHRPTRISSYQGILHKPVVTVLVRDNHIHVVDMIGVKLAFSVAFLIRKLAFLEVAEESLVWHDVMRDEGALYCLYLIVRHSIQMILLWRKQPFQGLIHLNPDAFQSIQTKTNHYFHVFESNACFVLKIVSHFRISQCLTCNFLPPL